MRQRCISSRRTLTRANRTGSEEERSGARATYRTHRKNYRRGITGAKREAWRSLIDDLDHDEWGQGYRLVVKRTGVRRLGTLSDQQQWAEARRLFPDVEDRLTVNLGNAADEDTDGSPFTLDELEEAVTRIRSRKAPGPDGVPPEVARAAL